LLVPGTNMSDTHAIDLHNKALPKEKKHHGTTNRTNIPYCMRPNSDTASFASVTDPFFPFPHNIKCPGNIARKYRTLCMESCGD
jgi:hypothetical protein